MDVARETFYKKLIEYDNNRSGWSRKPLTEERIKEIIADIKNIRMTTKKKTLDYYWIGKYDIIIDGTNEYLIFKRKNPEDPTIRIVPREKYFDILNQIHTTCGHGGRDRMIIDIKNDYYIPRKAVEIFVSVCPVCELRRNGNKNEFVPSSMTSRQWNEKGQLDLIDFQSCPDGEYNWLLSYQNLVTKFMVLRPMKSKNSFDVAHELLTIFLTLGAPHILLSDLGRVFVAGILEELIALWPICKIVHDAEDCSQKNTTEIVAMLNAWMAEKKSTKWSVGCLFVQYYKNASFHRYVGKFPNEEIFERIAKTSSHTSVDPTITKTTTTTITITEEQPLIIPKERIVEEEIIIKEEYSGHFKDEDSANITEQHSINDEQTINIKNEPCINIKNEIYIEEHRQDQLTDTENDELVEQKYIPVYDNPADTSHFKCNSCSNTIYSICRVVEDSHGQRLTVSCCMCKSEQDIVQSNSSKRVAEEITDSTDSPPKKVSIYDVGDSVLVAVPKVYRGPLNTKIIRGKIVDFRNNVYRVATKIGIIKNWFSLFDLQRTQIDYGETLDTAVSLEEAVASQPSSEGEAFIKCNCKPAVRQCHYNRCICYKNKVLCGRKCHSNLPCVNT